MSAGETYTVVYTVAIGGRARRVDHSANELAEWEPMYTRMIHDRSIHSLRVVDGAGRDVTRRFFS